MISRWPNPHDPPDADEMDRLLEANFRQRVANARGLMRELRRERYRRIFWRCAKEIGAVVAIALMAGIIAALFLRAIDQWAKP